MGSVGSAGSDGPIVVTGAGGFVGRWLLEALAEALPEVPILATTQGPAQGSGLCLDVGDEGAVDALVKQYRPRAIVNLAALSFVPDAERRPLEAYRVNLFGCMNLATAILRHAPRCRMIFVGSSEIYGGSFQGSAQGLDESAALNPMNIYASTKAAADILMGQYAYHGLDVVRFRPFNHVGPGQSGRFAVASFVQQIVSAERGRQPPVVTVGNVDNVRDFLDVRDVVSAYVEAIRLEDPLPPGTILNVASGQPRRIGDVLEQLLVSARIPLRVEVDEGLLRLTDIPFAVGNAGAAGRTLGWGPKIPFDATLSDLLNAARAEL